MPGEIEAELNKLYAVTGFKRLNPLWAKIEIVLGLFTAGIAMTMLAHSPTSVPGTDWLGPLVLFVLGWYLALAGHRSHLYQSANKLAAYLNLMKTG